MGGLHLRLVAGEARVELDETFGWVTNPDVGLSAQLTPRGECLGLYVDSLSAGELRVRELGDGRVQWAGAGDCTDALRTMQDGGWHTLSVPYAPGEPMALIVSGALSLDVEALFLTSEPVDAAGVG